MEDKCILGWEGCISAQKSESRVLAAAPPGSGWDQLSSSHPLAASSHPSVCERLCQQLYFMRRLGSSGTSMCHSNSFRHLQIFAWADGRFGRGEIELQTTKRHQQGPGRVDVRRSLNHPFPLLQKAGLTVDKKVQFRLLTGSVL